MRLVPRSVAANSLAPRSVAARSIAARSIAARSIAARSIAARSIAARSIAARSIAARSIAARSIAARSIAPSSIAARSIAASWPAPSSAPPTTVRRSVAPPVGCPRLSDDAGSCEPAVWPVVRRAAVHGARRARRPEKPVAGGRTDPLPRAHRARAGARRGQRRTTSPFQGHTWAREVEWGFTLDRQTRVIPDGAERLFTGTLLAMSNTQHDRTAGQGAPSGDWWSRRPRRSANDRKIAGVAGGLGRSFGVDPVLLRVGFVILALFGPGVVLYLLSWLLLPSDGDEVSAAESLIGKGQSSTPPVLTVGLAIAAAISFGWIPFWGGLPLFPLVIAGVIIVLVLRNGPGKATAPDATTTAPGRAQLAPTRRGPTGSGSRPTRGVSRPSHGVRRRNPGEPRPSSGWPSSPGRARPPAPRAATRRRHRSNSRRSGPTRTRRQAAGPTARVRRINLSKETPVAPESPPPHRRSRYRRPGTRSG